MATGGLERVKLQAKGTSREVYVIAGHPVYLPYPVMNSQGNELLLARLQLG